MKYVKVLLSLLGWYSSTICILEAKLESPILNQKCFNKAFTNILILLGLFPFFLLAIVLH